MIGEQIETLRKARNLTQVELSKKFGVTKQTVSNWENNNIAPSIDMLCKLALFFGCTTDFLLDLDNRRNFVDLGNLTPEQTAHIMQLVDDLNRLNKQTL